MKIQSVGVVGAGMIGQGLVLTAASNGLNVVFKEINRNMVNRARRSIEQAFDHEIERWAITASEKKAHLSRIRGTDSYDGIIQADILIEAVEDTWERKSSVMRDLDLFAAADRILITTTSTLSVSELGRQTRRPEKVVCIHFLRPVQRRPLAEIVRGFHTSKETYRVACDFAQALGKTPVEVNEAPGYVTTRVILPLLNEAMYAVMEGVASAEDVDKAMRLGFEIPMGPLQLADYMGLDDVHIAMERLFRELGDTKFRPCPLLRRLVRAGHLGVKSRRGFFEYDESGEIIRANGGAPQ